MAIRIITDSTANIPQQLLTEYAIGVVSLQVLFGTESYREVDLDNSTFYNKMTLSGTLPTSSQPALLDLVETFENTVQNGDAVVGVFLSSDMSGTFAAACLAKKLVLEKHPEAEIEIVDSRSNCMELGFITLAGAKAAKADLGMTAVLERVQNMIGRTRFLFAPEVLDYLRKGGRIGGAAALLGSLLQIKPILTVVEGKTAVLEKVRTKKRAMEEIIRVFLADVSQKGLGEVVVHHINNELDAEAMATYLRDKLKVPVPICSIGPVIGLHVGPGTVGLAYYTGS